MSDDITVLIHFDDQGNLDSVYCNRHQVNIIIRDDACENDVLYKMQSPDPVPPNLMEGNIGYKGDGSPADIKSIRLERELNGQKPFEVVK